MMKLFSELRDFFFVRARKKHNEAYAEKEHKFDLKVLFFPYYMFILLVVSFAIYKSGGNLNFVENNLINTIIVMTPLVIVYNWFFNFIYSKAEDIPIDKEMNNHKYKTLSRKSVAILIIGLLSFLLIPILF